MIVVAFLVGVSLRMTMEVGMGGAIYFQFVETKHEFDSPCQLRRGNSPRGQRQDPGRVNIGGSKILLGRERTSLGVCETIASTCPEKAIRGSESRGKRRSNSPNYKP